MSNEANVVPSDALPVVTVIANVAAHLASQDRSLSGMQLSDESRGKRLGYHLDNAVALVRGAYARITPIREEPARIVKPVSAIPGLSSR